LPPFEVTDPTQLAPADPAEISVFFSCAEPAPTAIPPPVAALLFAIVTFVSVADADGPALLTRRPPPTLAAPVALFPLIVTLVSAAVYRRPSCR
jgi:hypothetical protein